MAQSFNLTAQLNLRGPTNVRQIVAGIRRDLGTVSANVQLRLDPSAIRNTTGLNSALRNLNATLATTTTNATSAARAMRSFATAVNGINMRNMPQQLNAAATSITRINNASSRTASVVQDASSEMTEFGKQAGLAVRRFAAFTGVTSVIFGLTNAISKGVDAFIEYDKQFVKLQQVTGESANGLKGLANMISSLSTGLGVASSDLTEVSSTLAQAGLSAKDTERALKALALSSLAPSFDSMNETVEGSIALMRQFGISASDLEKALGSVNAVAAKFAVESSDIITAIQRTGGVFASASRGVSEGTDALNEFIAVFTSVRATTRESAETIATGLRTIFTRIQRGPTINALKQFGVDLTDAQDKFVGAYKAVELLSKGLNSIDPRDLKFSQIVEELGGFRQIGKVIPLIQQFATAQEALKVAQKGQGSLAADAAKAQESLSNKITKVKEEFLTLFREIGSSKGFQDMIRGALDLSSALIKVADSVKGVIPVLGVLAAFRGASALTQFGAGFLGAVKGQRKSEGGPIRKFARGGLVPGSGDSDSVSARLTPGEFVMRKSAVRSIGVGNLSRMNMGGEPVQKFMNGTTAAGVSRRRRIQARKPIDGWYSIINDTRTDEERAIEVRDAKSIRYNPKEQTVRAHAIDPKKYGKKITPQEYEAASGKRIIGKKIKGILQGEDLELIPNFTIALPESFNKALRRGDTSYIRLPDFQQALDSSFLLYGSNSIENKPLSSRVKKQGIKNIPTKIENEIRKAFKAEIARKADPPKPPGYVSRDEQIYRFADIAKSILTREKLWTTRPVEIMSRSSTGTGGTQSREFVPKDIAKSGIIRQYMAGSPGGVKEAEITPGELALQKASTSEIIRVLGAQKAAKAAGVSVAEVNQIIRSKDPAKQALRDAIDKEYIKAINRKAGGAKRQENRLSAQGLVVAGAGMFGSTFDKTEEIVSPLLSSSPKVRMVGGILSPKLAAKFDKQFGKASTRIANRASKKAMIYDVLDQLGMGRELNLDFDRTLAFGADKILSDPRTPAFAEFSDPKKVAAALQKAKLSSLGKELVKLVATKPDLLPAMRVVTARPQSTLGLVQQWLSQKGLPIPLSQFKGFGGPNVNAANIANLKAAFLNPSSLFVDDDPRNIAAADARGDVRTYQYGAKLSKPNINTDSTIQGGLLEKVIQNLGGPGAVKGLGFDFPNGLRGAAKYFGLPADIPTDVKRTLSGPSTIQDNVVTYLKNVMGYADGGTVPAMVSNGEAYVSPDMARKIGYGKLNKMNRADKNGLAGFASGGVSVFSGPGSGTSDSIGPIGLPVGSFILREKATKALGLKSGGTVSKFADGGPAGLLDADQLQTAASGSLLSSTRDFSRGLSTLFTNVRTFTRNLQADATVMAAIGQTAATSGRNFNQLMTAMNGAPPTFRQLEDALKRDIMALRSAGAATDIVAQREQVLATAREAQAAIVDRLTTQQSSRLNQFFVNLQDRITALGNSINSIPGVGRVTSGIGRIGGALGGNTGFYMSMGLGMLAGQGENIFGKRDSSANSAYYSSAFETGTSTLATGIATAGSLAMMGPVGAFAGGIVALTSAVTALTSGMREGEKALKEFNKNLANKKAEDASDRLSKAFEELSKDADNVDLQKKVSDRLREALNATNATINSDLDEAKTTAKSRDVSKMTYMEYIGASIPFFGTPMPESRLGVEDYDTVARQVSSRYTEENTAAMRNVEKALRSGATVSDIAGGSIDAKTGEFKFDKTNTKYASEREAIVRSDPEAFAKILPLIEQEQAAIKAGNNARADEIRLQINEATSRALLNNANVTALKKTIELEQAMEEANKAGRRLATSFNKLYDVIDQSINRMQYEAQQRQGALEDSSNNLTGESRTRSLSSKASNVLRNIEGYKNDPQAIQDAISSASNMLGAEAGKRVSGAAKLAIELPDDITKSISEELRSNRGLSADDAAARAKEIGRNKINDLSLPEEDKKNLITKFDNQIDEAKKKLRKDDSGLNTEASLDQFLESVEEAGSGLGEMGKKILDVSAKLTDFGAEALNQFSNNIALAAKAAKKAADLQAKARDIRYKSGMDLREAQTGVAESFDEANAKFMSDIGNLTGGITDPQAIGRNIEGLNKQYSDIEKQKQAALDRRDMDSAAKFTQQLQDTTDKLNNNKEALDKLANSAELAQKALDEVKNIRGLQQNREDFVNQLLTNTPEEADKLNMTMIRLQRNLSGGLNSPLNQRDARNAFNSTLRQTGSVREATRAGNTVLANQRKETLQLMKDPGFRGMMELNMRNSGMNPEQVKQRFDAMEGQLMKQMAIESGMIRNPMVQQALAAKINPNADPAMKAAADKFLQSTGLAAKATEEQARLELVNQQKILATSTDNLKQSIDSLKSSIDANMGFNKGSSAPMGADPAVNAGAIVSSSGMRMVPMNMPGLTGSLGSGTMTAGMTRQMENSPMFASKGAYVDFKPRGTDTVPAMLTPGEFVVNAKATSQHLPLLQAINSGSDAMVSKTMSRGGVVYLAGGGTARKRKDEEVVIPDPQPVEPVSQTAETPDTLSSSDYTLAMREQDIPDNRVEQISLPGIVQPQTSHGGRFDPIPQPMVDAINGAQIEAEARAAEATTITNDDISRSKDPTIPKGPMDLIKDSDKAMRDIALSVPVESQQQLIAQQQANAQQMQQQHAEFTQRAQARAFAASQGLFSVGEGTYAERSEAERRSRQIGIPVTVQEIKREKQEARSSRLSPEKKAEYDQRLKDKGLYVEATPMMALYESNMKLQKEQAEISRKIQMLQPAVTVANMPTAMQDELFANLPSSRPVTRGMPPGNGSLGPAARVDAAARKEASDQKRYDALKKKYDDPDANYRYTEEEQKFVWAREDKQREQARAVKAEQQAKDQTLAASAGPWSEQGKKEFDSIGAGTESVDQMKARFAQEDQDRKAASDAAYQAQLAKIEADSQERMKKIQTTSEEIFGKPASDPGASKNNDNVYAEWEATGGRKAYMDAIERRKSLEAQIAAIGYVPEVPLFPWQDDKYSEKVKLQKELAGLKIPEIPAAVQAAVNQELEDERKARIAAAPPLTGTPIKVGGRTVRVGANKKQNEERSKAFAQPSRADFDAKLAQRTEGAVDRLRQEEQKAQGTEEMFAGYREGMAAGRGDATATAARPMSDEPKERLAIIGIDDKRKALESSKARAESMMASHDRDMANMSTYEKLGQELTVLFNPSTWMAGGEKTAEDLTRGAYETTASAAKAQMDALATSGIASATDSQGRLAQLQKKAAGAEVQYTVNRTAGEANDPQKIGGIGDQQARNAERNIVSTAAELSAGVLTGGTATAGRAALLGAIEGAGVAGFDAAYARNTGQENRSAGQIARDVALSATVGAVTAGVFSGVAGAGRRAGKAAKMADEVPGTTMPTRQADLPDSDIPVLPEGNRKVLKTLQERSDWADARMSAQSRAMSGSFKTQDEVKQAAIDIFGPAYRKATDPKKQKILKEEAEKWMTNASRISKLGSDSPPTSVGSKVYQSSQRDRGSLRIRQPIDEAPSPTSSSTDFRAPVRPADPTPSNPRPATKQTIRQKADNIRNSLVKRGMDPDILKGMSDNELDILRSNWISISSEGGQREQAIKQWIEETTNRVNRAKATKTPTTVRPADPAPSTTKTQMTAAKQVDMLRVVSNEEFATHPLSKQLIGVGHSPEKAASLIEAQRALYGPLVQSSEELIEKLGGRKVLAPSNIEAIEKMSLEQAQAADLGYRSWGGSNKAEFANMRDFKQYSRDSGTIGPWDSSRAIKMRAGIDATNRNTSTEKTANYIFGGSNIEDLSEVYFEPKARDMRGSSVPNAAQRLAALRQIENDIRSGTVPTKAPPMPKAEDLSIDKLKEMAGVAKSTSATPTAREASVIQTVASNDTSTTKSVSQSTLFDPSRKPSITDHDYVEYYSSRFKGTPFHQESIKILQKRFLAYNKLNNNLNRDAERQAANQAWKDFLSKTQAAGYANGGIVYANNGALIAAQNQGTDTVPAMLTPGEFVVKRDQAQKHMPLLNAINNGYYSAGGPVRYMANGGIVTPHYMNEGGPTPSLPPIVSAGVSNGTGGINTGGLSSMIDSLQKAVNELGSLDMSEIATTIENSTKSFVAAGFQVGSSISSAANQMQQVAPQFNEVKGDFTFKHEFGTGAAAANNVLAHLGPTMQQTAAHTVGSALNKINRGAGQLGEGVLGDTSQIMGKPTVG